MILSTETLDRLAVCCDYPRAGMSESAHLAAASLGAAGAAAEPVVAALEELAGWLETAKNGAAEERYTQLFDLKPVCTLNLSHHLLGDTYQRGALLAGLAAELNLAKVEHRHDLPDHLPTLLRLVSRLRDDEEKRLLVHAIVTPGLGKVIEKLTESVGPWPALMRALPGLLANAFPKGDEVIPVPHKPLEVLPSCST